MTVEARFGRLRAAFDVVLDLPEAERDEAIRQLAGPDLAFEAELRELLAAAERSTTPLDTPPLRTFRAAEDPLAIESATVGAASGESREEVPGYRLLQPIGRGGSSTVYLAEQLGQGFTRKVALKILGRWMDAALLRRFRAEQRILAGLEHPGIARLYDAGITPTGRPYLAMEWVRGTNLLEHCAASGASTRERIVLFVAVLEAVAHAHASSVVHRDLKPGNILVSERGEPKLLDFGIARLLAVDREGAEGEPGDPTETRHRAMTPAYASPEQVRGDSVDRASDIYSLGIVLYELLVGRRPYRAPSGRLDELERAIREQDPAPTGLGLDLDAILQKAMRKEPELRYLSAADFAADLLRHLDGRPVLARRGTWLYRLGREFKRRRGFWANAALATGVAGGLALWLAGGIPGSRGAATDPNASPWLAMPVASAAAASYEEGLRQLSRLEPTRAAASFRRAVAADPEQPLIHAALATAEGRAGRDGEARAEGQRALSLSGGAPRESRLLVEAVSLRAAGQRTEEAKLRRALWLLLPRNFEVGYLFAQSLAEGGAQEEALEVAAKLRALPEGGRGEAADLRIGLIELEALNLLGRPQEVADRARRLADQANRRGLQAIAAAARLEESQAGDGLGRTDLTRSAANEARRLSAAAGEANGVARAVMYECMALFRESRHEQVEATCAEAIRLFERIGSSSGVARSLGILGASRQRQGLIHEARETFAQALDLETRNHLGDLPSQVRYQHNLANLDSDLGRLPEAEEGFRRAISTLREIGNEIGLVRALGALSVVLMKRGSLDEAKTLLGEAERLERTIGSPRELGYTQWLCGDLANLRGETAEAEAWYARAATHFAGIQEADLVARFQTSRKQLAEPSPRLCRDLERSADELSRLGDRSATELAAAISRCWSDSGSPKEAARWLDRADDQANSTELPEVRVDLELARASLAMEVRHWADAERILDRAAEDCRRGALGTLLLEIRLEQARLALARGDHPERVRTLAEELVRDAEAGHFGKIARKAKEILAVPRLARWERPHLDPPPQAGEDEARSEGLLSAQRARASITPQRSAPPSASGGGGTLRPSPRLRGAVRRGAAATSSALAAPQRPYLDPPPQAGEEEARLEGPLSVQRARESITPQRSVPPPASGGRPGGGPRCF